MLRNLVTSLFAEERVVTTVAKAKEVRPVAERLITIAKKESLHARRRVAAYVRDRDVVGKLFDTLSARFSARPGGYTRIILTGHRRHGDGAPTAILELLDSDWYRRRAEREKAKKDAKKKATAKDKEKPAGAKPEEAAEKPAEKAAEKKKKGSTAPKADKGKGEAKGRSATEAKSQEKKGRPKSK
jgi:large subunit ribosomal protein L17